MQAAATKWGVPASEVTLVDGVIAHGDKRAGFGDLLAEAAKVAHADPEVRTKLEAQGFDVVAETGPQLLPNIK